MSISIEAHDRICQDLHQQMRKLIVENERLKAAAQQALEAMESAEVDPHSSDAIHKAIAALRAALAEPVQECPNCASLQDQNTELDRKLAELEGQP